MENETKTKTATQKFSSETLQASVKTALENAINKRSSKYVKVVKLLLKKTGVDTTEHKNELLEMAVNTGDVEMLENLI